jgi:hypothetical protein
VLITWLLLEEVAVVLATLTPVDQGEEVLVVCLLPQDIQSLLELLTQLL